MIVFKIFCITHFALIIAEKHICSSNTTVELQADKIEFIESPNFPIFMTDTESENCGITFTKVLAPGEDVCQYFVVLFHQK